MMKGKEDCHEKIEESSFGGGYLLTKYLVPAFM